MNKNCIRCHKLEYSYFAAYRKMSSVLSFSQECSRVDLLNILEEEDLCKNCTYCNFVEKLKKSLEESGFFSHNNTVEMWKLKWKLLIENVLAYR